MRNSSWAGEEWVEERYECLRIGEKGLPPFTVSLNLGENKRKYREQAQGIGRELNIRANSLTRYAAKRR